MHEFGITNIPVGRKKTKGSYWKHLQWLRLCQVWSASRYSIRSYIYCYSDNTAVLFDWNEASTQITWDIMKMRFDDNLKENLTLFHPEN